MKNNQGFTAIEILVVLAIMSVLIALVIANFPLARKQSHLSRATYMFGQDVRRAQDLAFSAIEYKDAQGLIKPVSGYGLYVNLDTLGNKKYLLYADKSPGNNMYDEDDYLIEIIDLNKNTPEIIIKQIDNVNGRLADININSLDIKARIHSLVNSSEPAKFIFALENEDTTKSIWVNTAGLVEVK